MNKPRFSSIRWQQLSIALIILLAIVIRFFKLGEVPIELNRDEASLGYTAYSLLMTGKDEHGVSWPVQIESFGDWKLPLYVYTLIPFIKVFGLSAWTVRLPSALAGVSVVISSYFLIPLLFGKKQTKPWLRLLVPLSLAVSPWAVHFSHVAYEAHLALALFLWGLVALLVVLRDLASDKKRLGMLIFSLSFWALTLLAYHAYQVFTPLFWVLVVGLYWSDWQKFFAGKKSWLLASLAPFVLVGGLLFFGGVQEANNTKFSGLSIFDLSAYSQQTNLERSLVTHAEHPAIILASNKFGAFANQLQTNLLQLISPEFLFLSGGGNHAHNITGFGNFYPIMFFGLVVGLGSIFIKPKTWQLLLVGWLLAGSVAPLMTLQANHTIRFSPAFVAIEILSVYGFIVLFQKMQKYISKKALFSLIIILIMGLSYSAFRFLVHYNYFFPQQDARHWSWQMKTLVYWLDEQKANYDAIYLEDEQYSPYVYFLFYRQDDPASLKGRMDYYPHDAEGFRHVERLDNFYFRQIDWNDTQLYFDKRVLFIVEEEQIPAFNRFHEDYLLLTTLKHEAVPMGIEIWEYQGKN